jgi:hypothetical protein
MVAVLGPKTSAGLARSEVSTHSRTFVIKDRSIAPTQRSRLVSNTWRRLSVALSVWRLPASTDKPRIRPVEFH